MEISLFSKGLSDGKPLIPICCVCGKVRDLNNQWHMEVIPGDVILSHTYCPPCAQEELKKLRGLEFKKQLLVLG